MINNFFKILLIIFSILLAFGKIDPIFSVDSSIKTIDIVFIIFCGSFFLLKFNEFMKSIFSINFLILLSIFILFSFAQIMNGYAELIKPLFNFKFLMCGLFFVLLNQYLKNNCLMVHYLLLVFSLSCFLYSLLVLFVSPDLYQIIKGQMVVLDENPNSTSSRLAISTLYIIYFLLQNPLKWTSKRFLLLISLPTLLSMIIMSGSRGSLLAILIGSYLIFIFSNIGKLKKIILTVISFIGSVFLFNYLFNSDDLSGRWEKALDGDTAGRTDIWESVLKIVIKNPLGVGETGYVENIINLSGVYIDTHNLFLYILVCGGYLSFLIFLIFLIFIFRNCYCFRINIWFFSPHYIFISFKICTKSCKRIKSHNIFVIFNKFV